MRMDGGRRIAVCDTAASVAHRIVSTRMAMDMAMAMAMAAVSALPPDMR
jgi:hypothetical protein